MKALVGAFNQEKALVGAFSVIVQPVVEPMERYTALDLGDVLRVEVCCPAGAVAVAHEAGQVLTLVTVTPVIHDDVKDDRGYLLRRTVDC